MEIKKPTTIREYILLFPAATQAQLHQVWETIKAAAPTATEKISYGIPTFFLNGNLIHFAAYNKHIGLYPGPKAIVEFKAALTPYKCAKGSIQFPLTEAMPLALIRSITAFNVIKNSKK